MTLKFSQTTFFNRTILLLLLLSLALTPSSSHAQEESTWTPRTEGQVEDAQSTAADILTSAEYHDDGVVQTRNWFSRALDNVGQAVSDFLERLFGNRSTNSGVPDVPQGGADILSVIMWGILILAVIAFLIFAFRKFNWGVASKLRKKRVGGLLDDDEPDRSADEWLEQADRLAAEGEFRKAVRCLYLACLVRIDEAGVARFIRAETNWEHLHRIEASTKSPESFQFRTITQKFDLIWYGFRTQGQPDVQEFRAFYVELCKILNIQNAA